MKKIKLLLMLVLVMAIAFTGCAKEEAPEPTAVPTEAPTEAPTAEPTAEPVEELTIVSTVPSVTEILFELGVGENVIGVDASSDYPAGAMNIEKVGDFNGFDVEKVVSLNPTVVLAGNKLQAEFIAQLEDLDVNVIGVEPTYYEDIATSIATIGEAVGKVDEANALIAKMDEDMQSVKDLGSALETKPTVYYVMSIGDANNWTSGEGSFINSVMEFAGGDCITKDCGMEWMNYPLEDLLTADPDVLVVSDYVNLEELKADEVYKELSAVKNDKLIVINTDLISRPGPRIAEAAQIIYEGLAQ